MPSDKPRDEYQAALAELIDAREYRLAWRLFRLELRKARLGRYKTRLIRKIADYHDACDAYETEVIQTTLDRELPEIL